MKVHACNLVVISGNPDLGQLQYHEREGNVSLPAAVRFEPAFVFTTLQFTFTWIDKDHETIFEYCELVRRETVWCFVPVPPVARQHAQLVVKCGEQQISIVTLYVEENDCTRTETLTYCSELRRYFEAERLRIQSLPFTEMLAQASSALARTGSKLIFVTGSVGKTSTKELLANALKPNHRICCSTDSWNFPHETCSQILLNIEWARVFVMEMALNAHMREIGVHLPPNYLVFTSLTDAHTAFSPKLEAIAESKASLACGMKGGVVIYNATPDLIETALMVAVGEEARLVHWVSCSAFSDVAASFQCTISNGAYQISDGHRACSVAVREDLSIPPISIALTAACLDQLTGDWLSPIRASLKDFQGVPLRQQILRKGHITLINDAYNSSPAAVKDLITRMCKITDGPKVLIMTKMLDLGELCDVSHQGVISFARESNITVIGVGEYFGVGQPEHLLHCCRPEELLVREDVLNFLRSASVVALKGSYMSGLHSLAKDLLQAAAGQ